MKKREASEAVFTPPSAPTAGPARPKRGQAQNPAQQSEKPLFTTVPRELPPRLTIPSSSSSSAPVQEYTSHMTHSIEPVVTFPARMHAALQTQSSLPPPLPPMSSLDTPPAPEPIVPRRAPPAKRAKAKKRKRVDEDEEDDFLDELENINHDGGYDDDYTGSTSVRASGPAAKRPRRNVPPPPPPAVVPPRANASLPPLPTTPSGDSMRTFDSPLSPLTDLTSSSPPALPPFAPSPAPPQTPTPLPPAAYTPAAMPHPPLRTPTPLTAARLPLPASPVSTLTPSPQMQQHMHIPAASHPAPAASAKRGPRRQPAVPAFSSGAPALSPVASTSAAVKDETSGVPAGPSATGAMQPTYRAFPVGMETRTTEYPLWYRRYPLIAAFRPYDPLGDAVLGSYVPSPCCDTTGTDAFTSAVRSARSSLAARRSITRPRCTISIRRDMSRVQAARSRACARCAQSRKCAVARASSSGSL